MTQIVARKNPVAFKTQAIAVTASPEVLRYEPIGSPLSFAQMQQLRQPLRLDDPHQFQATLANLGVSVDLHLRWQQRDFRLLVRQDRQDHGDQVLKLLSGYVPSHELRVPLLTVMTEIAEELLIEANSGWLQGRYQDTWLPQPYADSLIRDEERHFALSTRAGDARPVLCRELNLLERPHAYVHLPTSSLQLVYQMQLSLPDDIESPSLLHADEFLDQESGELVARMDHQRPELFLAEYRNDEPTGELYHLQRGELISQPSADLLLSEAFAPQEGWLIAAGNCPLHQGLGRR
ncbi:metal ABC transporter ATPase [Halopseudomonas sp.]|uniref:metal ABC transporter ATPase n=1 Tax=Halopseudomonas sp. TaxID=2901191 RepID=UPI00311E16B3